MSLFGYGDALGKYVKVNDTWLQVIGVLKPQAGSDTDVEGVQTLEPQQHDHRAVEHRDAAVRRPDQLSEGRNRRHLYEGAAERRLHRNFQRGHRHAGGHPQGRRRLHRHGARRAAGTEETDAVHLQYRHDLHRRHFAAGGRHRHHEHHAGHGARSAPGKSAFAGPSAHGRPILSASS